MVDIVTAEGVATSTMMAVRCVGKQVPECCKLPHGNPKHKADRGGLVRSFVGY